MKTAMMLMMQYETPVIPAKKVCEDFFAPLTFTVFMRKIGNGEIALPVIRMEQSREGAKGVYLNDLAEYIDKLRDAAVKESKALQS